MTKTKTKTLTLILASAALTAAIGLPAWSAMQDAAESDSATPLSSLMGSEQTARPIILADSEASDDEDENEGTSKRADDDDDCEEDEGNCGSAAAAPAPAGSVAPPQNGLFGTEPAQVQVK